MLSWFKVFDVLPAWLWAFICAGLIASLAVTSHRLQREQIAHASAVSEFSTERAAAATLALVQSEQYRLLEQELTHAQAINALEVATLQQGLERSRAAAAAASTRLQDGIRTAAAQARARCADPAVADLREAADDPIGVLADVLGRADARAGALADIADQRGIAGDACERAYDAAHQALKD